MADPQRGLVILDVDGVVLKGHLLVALSRTLGRRRYVRTLWNCLLFDKALIGLEELLSSVYGRLEGQAVARVWEAYRATRLRPGAEETVRALKAHGWKVMLVSSGVPDPIVADLVARLGADGGAGIHLGTDDGRLTGRISGELRLAEGKLAYVDRMVKEGNGSWEDVVVVGDDRNNLPLMLKAGVSIGFGAMREVRGRARFVVDAPNLDAILGLVLEPPEEPTTPPEEQHPIAIEPWFLELRRKLLHGTAALVPLLLWVCPMAVPLALILASVLYVIAEELRLNGVHVPVLSWLSKSVMRHGERRALAVAPLTMALGVGACIVFYPFPVACACIFVLAFTDSTACIVGERWGRLRLPYSRRKTLEGLLAGIVIGVVAAGVFVGPLCALAGGTVAGLVESLNLRDWDNFWVPVVAGLVMEGFHLAGL